jgi:hypothetical protein
MSDVDRLSPKAMNVLQFSMYTIETIFQKEEAQTKTEENKNVRMNISV